MKTLIEITTALSLVCGPAFAQMTGAPGAAQSDANVRTKGHTEMSVMKKSKTSGMKKSKAFKKNMMPKEDATQNSMSK